MNSLKPVLPDRFAELRPDTMAGPLYRVLIHNDDVTPMDFVVHILRTVFVVPSPNAEHITYTAHVSGTAYVQTLPLAEARRRIGLGHFTARLQGLPLRFSMEPE